LKRVAALGILVGMSKAEDYLNKARQCRQRAEAEQDPESAEMWRQMAASYEGLANGVWIYAKLEGIEAAEEGIEAAE
jgi:hypothetical protein